jgi:hypothetical protein
MRRRAVLLILLMASVSIQPALSQTASDSNAPATTLARQAQVSPVLQHNVGTLAEMMRDIHLLLHLGPLTQKEAGDLSDIMTRIGVMMKEMSGSQAEKFQSRHERELQKMKKQLAEIKARLESQKRK